MAKELNRSINLESDAPSAHIIDDEKERLRQAYRDWGHRPSVYEDRRPPQPPSYHDDEDEENNTDEREVTIDMT